MGSSTFFDLVAESPAFRAPRELLTSPGDRTGGRISVTGEDLARDVANLGAGLVAYGLSPGDRVAVMADRGDDSWVAELAALAAGGCCVPLPSLPTPAALKRTMKDSGARFAIVSDAPALERLLEVRPELPDLEMVLVLREPSAGRALPAILASAARSQGAASLSAAPGLLKEARSRIGAADTAYVVGPGDADPRSGMIRLSHDNLRLAAGALAETIPIEAGDRALSLLPPGQMAARPWYAALVSLGATLAFVDSPNGHAELPVLRPTLVLAEGAAADAWLGALVEGVVGRAITRRVSLAWARSRRLAAARPGLSGDRLEVRPSWGSGLADRVVLDRIREAAGGRLRFVVSVAEPLGLSRVRSWLATGLPVLEGIGIPETSGVLCQSAPRAFRPGAVGRPLPGLGLRVDDDGQIWIRGPMVARGLAPAKAPGVADRSWFRTGLVGRQDEHGFVTLV